MLYTALYLARGVRETGAADGFYSFLYARSLAFDGDVDFRNDYALCGDPYTVGVDRGTGHPDNAAYAGPAVFWVPLLTVARLFERLPSDADPATRAACHGPWTKSALGIAMP